MSLDKQLLLPSRPRCVCSTMGFENSLWNDRYYPDNCPREWRLAYFMNDFRAVYLLCADWFGPGAQIAEIAAELDECFELIVEWPPLTDEQNAKTTLSVLESLAQNVACIVINVDGISAPDLTIAHSAISERYAVNFYSKTLDTQAQNALVREYQTGFVWDPRQAEAPISPVDYQVVRLPCQSLRDVKSVLHQLRPFIEQDARAGLFFEPAKQSVHRAMEVRTLTELMDLA
jgi:hypothetical protein